MADDLPPNVFELAPPDGGIPTRPSRAPFRPDPTGLTDILHMTHMKHSHHHVAKMLALGEKPTKIAAVTGYSPSSISQFKHNEAFQELVEFYADIAQEVWTDAQVRMRNLGMDTLDILQNRLETDPTSFANRELMELAEILLVKTGGRSGVANGVAGAGGGPTNISVTFVSSQPQAGAMVDVTPNAAVTVEG